LACKLVRYSVRYFQSNVERHIPGDIGATEGKVLVAAIDVPTASDIGAPNASSARVRVTVRERKVAMLY
jgi:hypothetical protein